MLAKLVSSRRAMPRPVPLEPKRRVSDTFAGDAERAVGQAGLVRTAVTLTVVQCMVKLPATEPNFVLGR